MACTIFKSTDLSLDLLLTIYSFAEGFKKKAVVSVGRPSNSEILLQFTHVSPTRVTWISMRDMAVYVNFSSAQIFVCRGIDLGSNIALGRLPLSFDYHQRRSQPRE